MMKKITTSTLMILMFVSLFSQGDGYKLKGYIYDNYTNKPISNAHIKIKGTDIATSTNKQGYYSISYNSIPCELICTHVRYDTLKIHLRSDQKNLNLKLNEHIYECPVVIIPVKKPVNLVKRKFYDVSDYEFIDSNIVMLAYCYSETKNPWLILMNTQGDTLHTQQIAQGEKIYRDCYDKLHLLSHDSAYEFSYESGQFNFYNSNTLENFYNLHKSCLAYLNEIKYCHQYLYNDQVLAYYTIDKNDKIADFRMVADEVGIRRLFDRNRFHSMGASAATEADIRFEEMCFFDPIFAPLIKVKNNICIINYVDSTIEIYNKYSKLIDRIPVNFHLTNNWKEEIYVDNIEGKVYTVFKKSGISTLREIDLNSGKLSGSIKIPEFHFIENIKIHDSAVYFLYRRNKPADLMKLYKLDIN